MADNHRPLRVPLPMWERYAKIVGDIGRTADLKTFMDWRIDNPGHQLADDIQSPHDFLATLRIDDQRWQRFKATVGDGACSSEMRRYIRWRVENPREPLPGQRTRPLRRSSRRPALV